MNLTKMRSEVDSAFKIVTQLEYAINSVMQNRVPAEPATFEVLFKALNKSIGHIESLAMGIGRGEDLSPAEQAVFLHIINGKTNKEISDLLFVTDKTIKYHITQIFKKKSVSSRSQLISNHFILETETLKKQLKELQNG